MTTEALVALVFAPLLAAVALVVAPPRWSALVVAFGLLPVPAAVTVLTAAVVRDGPVVLALAGFAPPLGIHWYVDGFALATLWLSLVVSAFVSVHATASFPFASPGGRRFWPLWLLLVAGVHALFVSGDLFNLYVTLELVTLAGVALVALSDAPAALRAAMRYLLLGLVASLFYLLATALVYGQVGTLDLHALAGTDGGGALFATAAALLVTGLLVKGAVVPLHVWLPAAHGKAPGPVSAILSALVVKVALVVLIRLWFWSGLLDGAGAAAATLLGGLGAGAVVYGSVAALLQTRLKMLVAYSTVAQLGYVLLVFPLASSGALQAVTFHLVAHGLAKAAMFLAAANLAAALGGDALQRLVGADRRHGVDVLAFALAGVSIMGLPPSGGFVAKWMLLEAAWQQQGWVWVAVVSVGSLLAAVYVFRVVALAYAQVGPTRAARSRATSARATVARPASLAALALALLAVGLGVGSAPLLDLIAGSLPPGWAP